MEEKEQAILGHKTRVDVGERNMQGNKYLFCVLFPSCLQALLLQSSVLTAQMADLKPFPHSH